MKKILCLILSPLPFMAFTRMPDTKAVAERPAVAYKAASNASMVEYAASDKPAITEDGEEDIKELIDYAFTLLGSPYIYAGITPEGFDCSGYTTHVFRKFGINLPHSSAMQAKQGEHVAREDARVGDVVIFTGTNPSVRKPGHVGIIVSSPGDTISFIHCSSNGGVKVSKVEGTRYNTRFLEIRRVTE